MRRIHEERMKVCKLSQIAAEVALKEMAGLRVTWISGSLETLPQEA